jgi:hypothetical protein
MGGFDWKRAGLGLATGGLSELERAGVGPSAGASAFGINTGGGGGKGGGGKGAKPPGVPDLVGAAREQANLNNEGVREQTAANRPDQFGPFGSSQWSQGADGAWTQNVSLAPGLQQGADNLMSQIGYQGPVGTGDQARQQAIDSAYTQSASRLDPEWQAREQSTRAALAAQGLDPGSEAFGAEMGNFSRGRNDAYSSAMASAIGQGSVAGHLAFQDNLAAANNPFQQLQSLQGLANPGGFVAAGRTAAPELVNALGQQYQGELGQYGMQQAGKNSQMGGAANLAGLLFGKPPTP